MRNGVLDWTDAAAPGVPSFEFLDDIGDADILYPSISGAATELSAADRLTMKKLFEHGSRRYSGRRH